MTLRRSMSTTHSRVRLSFRGGNRPCSSLDARAREKRVGFERSPECLDVCELDKAGIQHQHRGAKHERDTHGADEPSRGG